MKIKDQHDKIIEAVAEIEDFSLFTGNGKTIMYRVIHLESARPTWVLQRKIPKATAWTLDLFGNAFTLQNLYEAVDRRKSMTKLNRSPRTWLDFMTTQQHKGLSTKVFEDSCREHTEVSSIHCK
jgi:hypothetical protein